MFSEEVRTLGSNVDNTGQYVLCCVGATKHTKDTGMPVIRNVKTARSCVRRMLFFSELKKIFDNVRTEFLKHPGCTHVNL